MARLFELSKAIGKVVLLPGPDALAQGLAVRRLDLDGVDSRLRHQQRCVRPLMILAEPTAERVAAESFSRAARRRNTKALPRVRRESGGHARDTTGVQRVNAGARPGLDSPLVDYPSPLRAGERGIGGSTVD
jgi:hypothetical protein